MAGIYIHIPFCKQKCNYCDFHFSTSLRFKDEVIAAMLKELDLRKDYLEGDTVETIYFGGGTPSFLTNGEISLFLDKIRQLYSVEQDAEITLEANPDDLNIIRLEDYKKAGINRLSIGVQSFFDDHLKWMNRAHSGKEAIEAVKKAQNVGFENITIDLIYGIPQMTKEEWKENIATSIGLNVPHISAYNLTVEEGTALHYFVKTGKTRNVSDEQGSAHFNILKDTLKQNGFIQYEVSNFGKESYFSRHNTSYWRGAKYLGIGPSAHSYNLLSRQWNIANNKRYLDCVINGEPYFEIEGLSRKDRFNEYILTGLRTIWGCDLERIEKEFGESVVKSLRNKLKNLGENIDLQYPKFKLTEKGMLFADGIASDLFID